MYVGKRISSIIIFICAFIALLLIGFESELVFQCGDYDIIASSKVLYYYWFKTMPRGGSIRLRKEGIDGLKREGSHAVGILTKFLHEDRHPACRAYAAIALGEIGNKEAFPALLQALNDKDAAVRQCTASALVKVGGKKAVPFLIHLLHDKDVYVREAAVVALGDLSDPRCVPALADVVQKDKDLSGLAASMLRRKHESY